MVRVEIDPGAGFCFGVDQVIKMAESELKEGRELFGLGDMVHNGQEVKRLENLGMQTITHEQLSDIKSGRVLIRAHGEPPETFRAAGSHQVEIIDGTCPIVLKLQERIRKAYQAMDRQKEQLVIFGKPDHPETIGLLGQVDGDAVVITSPDDISNVDSSKSVHLFSQTTMDPDLFGSVEVALKEYLAGTIKASFRSNCTICGQMKKRKPGLSSFAKNHDVVVFVSGRNSSNGKMLFEFCRSLNSRSYWISKSSELDPEWFSGGGIIGISGATSTSRAQLESVRNQVEKITSS
jgi:4-hydroxy-3-methylbut-2-enyl diphosphate reductase